MVAPIVLAPIAVSVGKELMQMALADKFEQRSLEKAKLKSYISELRIAAERDVALEREKTAQLAIEARREIAVKMLDLAQHVFDRKSDMLETKFTSTLNIFHERLKSITAEQKELTTTFNRATGVERVEISEYRRSLRAEAIDLESAIKSLERDYDASIQLLEISLNSSLPDIKRLT